MLYKGHQDTSQDKNLLRPRFLSKDQNGLKFVIPKHGTHPKCNQICQGTHQFYTKQS